ncbi:MAG: hypothetical protein IPK03_09095 [Bacteroidetes bacterium]|nr:hypothetical protein [Bacteroidota bacterium]
MPDGYLGNDTTSSLVCQPLSGVYTMDTTLPASATNFVNFNTIALKLNNCGVAGPVTINIANGTYAEQFTLNQIYGTSATNTVTFQSASGIAANAVIQFNGGSSAANNFVVKMNGADYTIWKNLTLQSTNASFSTLVWQLNNTRFNTYRKVAFNGPSGSLTSTNNALVFANNTSTATPGQGDDNNIFDSCLFNNGAYGIYSYVSYGSAYTYNCAFTNNTFNNQYYMGMNLSFHLSMNIHNNNINTNSTYSNYYGINYASNTGIQHAGKISRNRISAPNANGYGIAAYYMNGPNCSVLNNMINIGVGSGSPSYGMYMWYSNCKIHHNTVNITSGNANSYAAYIYNNEYSRPSSDIRYNILANSGNGATAGYCIYSVSNNTPFTTIDSNVYYQGAGAGNFGNFNGSVYTTFAAWKAEWVLLMILALL